MSDNSNLAYKIDKVVDLLAHAYTDLLLVSDRAVEAELEEYIVESLDETANGIQAMLDNLLDIHSDYEDVLKDVPVD